MRHEDEQPAESELLLHAEFLRRLAARLLRDEHGAEDVVQDAMVVALERGHERRGHLRAWLAGVVKNLALMARRRRERHARIEGRLPRPDPEPAAADTAGRMEIARRLVDAVASLDDPYRTVVVFRFFDGMTSAEIALRLGCPAATVRTRLRRALDMLRARLDREHDDSRRAWMLALLPLLGRRRPAAESLATAGGGVLMKKAAVILVLVLLLLFGAATVIVLDDANDPEGSATLPMREESNKAQQGKASPDETADTIVANQGGETQDGNSHPPDDVAEILLVGPDGLPIVDAVVAIHEDTLGRRLGIDPLPVRAVGRTDHEGRTRLPAPFGQRHMLKISGDGLPTMVDLECYGGNVTRLEIPVVASFLGVVCDAETGEPLEGAEVTVMDFAMCGLMHEWRVKTDAHGHYRVDGIGPGLLNMWARHPEYAEGFPEAAVSRAVPGEETVLDIRLRRGVRLSLRVTDEKSGLALPEVEVVWHRDSVARGPGDLLTTTPVSRTVGSLEIRAEGYLNEDVLYVDRGPAHAPIDVRMTRGVPVRGVIRRPDGSPAQGIPVRVLTTRRGQELENWRVTRSDPDGGFEVVGADPGGTLRWEIDLPSGGRRDIDPILVAADATEVALAPIVLGRTVTVRGRLLDPDGRPFPRAFMKALRDKENHDLLATCFVDPRGRFRLAGLPPGPVILTAGSLLGWAGQIRRLVIREDVRISWTLDRGLEVSGVVVTEDGSPTPELKLKVGSVGYARTDALGWFRVQGLGPGPHRVQISHRPDIGVDDVPGGTRNVRLVLPR
jgi:RNA polymerase sigma factor (sigma-70 family)